MSRAKTISWKKAHPRYMREYGWRRREMMRIEVLSHYGPSGQLCCSWTDCHISDPDMLVLDHTLDNGAEERRQGKGRGWNFYAHLKREGFPIGYQTLCCNHNHKKEIIRQRRLRKTD